MLVSKAGGAVAGLSANVAGGGIAGGGGVAGGAYAPLYLTTSLRDVAFDIEELEAYALARLRLLKAVESAKTSASIAGVKSPEWRDLKATVRKLERQHDMHVPGKGAKNALHESQMLKDEASHFLLRLALCREFDTRSWLLGAECTLFSARLEGASSDTVLRCIKRCRGPDVAPVSKHELEADDRLIGRQLDDVARGMCRNKNGAGGTRYFRVAFEQVPNLVRQKRVLLRGGLAYVPELHVQDVVTGLFRSHMNQSLTLASKAVGLAEGDRRMRPILESVRQHHAADDASKAAFDDNSTERINLRQLNDNVVNMPLCMQIMLEKLRENHHLRYQGRLQLGVFLKGCGLSMEESLHFWKGEFARGNIDAAKFDKAYAYNIRHHYGREGKRRNLTPFACIKIINERPGPAEYHGCPYRELPEDILTRKLQGMGIGDKQTVDNIVAKTKDGNFNVACGMCFKATQPPAQDNNNNEDFITTHPNEYFIEARRRRLAKNPSNTKYENLSQDDNDMDNNTMDMDVGATMESNGDNTHTQNSNQSNGEDKQTENNNNYSNQQGIIANNDNNGNENNKSEAKEGDGKEDEDITMKDEGGGEQKEGSSDRIEKRDAEETGSAR